MPIDTSILQGIKPVQLKDPLEQYSNFLTVKGQIQQGAARDMELQDAQRKIAKRNALAGGFAAGMGPDGQLDYDKVGAYLTANGHGDLYPEIQEAKIKLSKAQNDSDKVFSDLVKDRLEMGRAQLSGVTTPEQVAGFITSQFSDPITGRFLRSQGHTPEEAMGKLQHAVKTGGFEKMLMEMKAGTKEANENQYLQMDGGSHQDLLSVNKFGTPKPNLVRSIKVEAGPRDPKGTTIIMPKGLSAYETAMGKGVAEKDLALLDKGPAAIRQIERADRIADILEDPAYVGWRGDFRLAAAKALNLGGANASEQIKNTELLARELAASTMESFKAYDLGARGIDTPKEREFLQSIAGMTEMDHATLVHLNKLNRDTAEAVIQMRNERVPQMPRNVISQLNVDVKPIKVTPYRSIRSIPREHRSELLRDPSGDAKAEFDELYGNGAAARVLAAGSK